MSEIFIVGAADSPLGIVTDLNENGMAAVASLEALDEAGLTVADVDGVFTNYMGEEGSVQLGEYLGIQPRYAESSDLGGASFEVFVHHAALAIDAGHCDVALIAYASRQRSKRGRVREMPGASDSLMAQFEAPFGLAAPLGYFALQAARHMHEFGTTEEHLAEIAVAARKWAQLNPKAWSRDELTIDDVLASRRISDPLKRLDCCLILDGGGAIILTSGDRARDARKTPIRVLGAGESHEQWSITQARSIVDTPGQRSARDALSRAGVSIEDIDVFQPYDATTISVLLALEDVGFCGKGEAGDFVADGRLRPGGSLPSMTSGGGLSFNHPGALGIHLLTESVRQLRGESGERQVPDARIAMAHGIGGLASVASTVVLSRD